MSEAHKESRVRTPKCFFTKPRAALFGGLVGGVLASYFLVMGGEEYSLEREKASREQKNLPDKILPGAFCPISYKLVDASAVNVDCSRHGEVVYSETPKPHYYVMESGIPKCKGWLLDSGSEYLQERFARARQEFCQRGGVEACLSYNNENARPLPVYRTPIIPASRGGQPTNLYPEPNHH